MKIPLCDLKALYSAYKEEIDAAFFRVMQSGWFILGQETAAFEKEFAQYCGMPYCIAVASGTDALELALRATGVQPGDNVVTVSHTAVATVAAIERAGANPILADVDPDRFTMNPESLERILQRFSAKAVVPVHLYGQCADMDSIVRIAHAHGCRVVEDCAQAHGALLHNRKAATFGDAAAFSFYPTKNLGAFGDGGAVVVHDQNMAEHVRMLRQYGWKERYISTEKGCNSRLDELQAAFLRVRLAHLDEDNALRQKAAKVYFEELGDLPELDLPKVAADCQHVWHLFVIKILNRNALAAMLAEQGIMTAVHYPVPVHLQPAYAGRVQIDPAGLAVTENLAPCILSLPMHPHLDSATIGIVCSAIRAAFFSD